MHLTSIIDQIHHTLTNQFLIVLIGLPLRFVKSALK